MKLRIRKLAGRNEARACAQIMSTSEPWITLQRNFAESLKILLHPRREIYVAALKTEIIGFIILQLEGTFTGYIQTIAVKEGWRNHGIGSALLAFAEDKIFSIKPNVFLCVSSFNKKAQRLYRRLGYEKIGVIRNFIVNGHDEVLLRKTIGPLVGFKISRKSYARSSR